MVVASVEGGSKSASAADTDALLRQLLGESSLSTSEADETRLEKLLDQHGGTEVASTSGRTDDIFKKSTQGHARNTSVGSSVVTTSEVLSPEKLHQLAQEEKKKYAQLKKDGRNEEALKAFKRSKELDRQADALEFSLKRTKRRASVQVNEPVQAKEDRSGVMPQDRSSHEGRSSALKGRRAMSLNAADQNDDVVSALKELGWNDADLNGKPQKQGIDSDLAAILESIEDAPRDTTPTKVGNTPAVPDTNTGGPVQLQILGHKRKALALKKEGKMAEAKEELKKAKILERQLEEAALLGKEDEEEDELSVMMRSLEREAALGDKRHGVDDPLDLSKFAGFAEDEDDARVDVSDADLNDPAMVQALRAMGWTEEAHALQKSTEPDPSLQHLHSIITKEQELQKQILASKRKSLGLRREGKVEEAHSELRHSKALERQLEELKIRSGPSAHPSEASRIAQSYGSSSTPFAGLDTILQDDEVDANVTENDMQDPELMTALRALGFAEEPPVVKHVQAAVHPSKDTAASQQEILAIKRSALAFKREGKTAEAKEQLMRSRNLEQMLQMQVQKSTSEVQRTGPRHGASIIDENALTQSQAFVPSAPDFSSGTEDEVGEDNDAAVDESDFLDPDLAAALQAIGWQDDASSQKDFKSTTPIIQTPPVASVAPLKAEPREHRSRSELQRELLGLKRRALAFRREGKVETADEILEQAKILEEQLEGVQSPEPPGRVKRPPTGFSGQAAHEPSMFARSVGDIQVTDDDMLDPHLLTALQNMGWQDEAPHVRQGAHSQGTVRLSESPVPVNTADNQGGKNCEPAGTSGQPTSWDGKARNDRTTFEPGGPNKLVTATDAVQRAEGDWDESDPFRGEFGEIGETVDIAPPLFDDPLRNVGKFLKSVLAPSAAAPVKGTPFDLLTGDIWRPKFDTDANVHSSVQNVGRPNEKDVDALDPGVMSGLSELEKTDSKEVKVKKLGSLTDEMQNKDRAGGSQADPDGRKMTAGNSEEVNKNIAQQKIHTGSTAASIIGTSAASLQQEVLAHKRMALALKREGRRAEATDALRQAKLLEQQLAQLQVDKNQYSGDQRNEDSRASASSVQALKVAEPPHPQAKTGGLTKEEKQQQVRQGKDRMKLQQESLAHKRKALGLRREGKTAEAETEFELAKALEEQMKDLDPEKGVDAEDVGIVDDIFDPQLMAALRGLGLTDDGSKATAPKSNSVAQLTNPPSSGLNSGNARSSSESSFLAQSQNSTRPKDMEDRIKAEKIKAVQLKRAGKPTEAMNALREAKKLEKQLFGVISG